jgi:hypothetical protein
VPFTIRGRLADPSALRWRIAPGPDPVDGPSLHAALAAAAATWSAEPGVGFRAVGADVPAELIVSWQTASSDPCGRFGRDDSVAHTGPMGPGTFVHLDASRAWTLEPGASGERLDVALAHELGHVLGLDHTPDPSALMYPDTHLAAPAASDRAGLASLYGGGEDGPGDVVILAAVGEGRAAPTLRRIAPPGRTALSLFDTDGDGDDELLVWRTDREGIGALTVYQFATVDAAGDPQARLERSIGPLLDVVPPGAISCLRTGPDGRRWLLTIEAEDLRVYGFDAEGRLRKPDVEERIALDVDALLAARGPDVLAGTSASSGAVHRTDGRPAKELVGDLDGDGRAERIRRLGNEP